MGAHGDTPHAGQCFLAYQTNAIQRAAIGEQREKLFALRMPDRTGMFFSMYKAVQPRLVTEFVYRHSPKDKDALVYMAMETSEAEAKKMSPEMFAADVISALGKHEVYAIDVLISSGEGVVS
jgi:hypothetical protein